MKIHSIFQSINGEVTAAHQGSVCTFIRFQGCSAGCKYCDTKDSQDPNAGEDMEYRAVYAAVKKLPIKTRFITITGGEPLEQSNELFKLIKLIKDTRASSHITLETNGFFPIGMLPISLIDSIVMDYKLTHNNKDVMGYNFGKMRDTDWLKIPIQSELDFKQAMVIRNRFYKGAYIPRLPRLALSAVKPITPKKLLSWMFEAKVTDVVLNVQLHKLIGVS